ncbi:MAG: threonine-phosphate decarboxylase CobD [Desulfobacca sp.]|nr:threonine-phosphate decarboxylase CobD [Desulfobacca sp.]
MTLYNSPAIRPWHGGDLNSARQRYGSGPRLDFSANINPWGPPPAVLRELPNLLPGIVHYPDPFAGQLKQLLADWLGIGPEHLLLGNGSTELIYLLPRVCRVSRVAFPAPSFSEYEYAARLASATCLYLELQPPTFAWDLAALKELMPQVDMIFLCNPNNPTGTLFSAGELAEILAVLPPRTKLVMDEAFIDFVADKAELTLVQRAREDSRVLVLGSLTKFFALPGLRLGYLVGTSEVVGQLAAHLPPWNLNHLAQAAGCLALQDQEYVQRSRQSMAAARSRFYQDLQTVPGITALPPTANFIFARLDDQGPSAAQLAEQLGRRGFLIRDCANYRGLDDYCLRVAVRREAENTDLVKALKEILTGGA